MRKNYGSIFDRLWTKDQSCTWVTTVCKAVYRLRIYCCMSRIFARNSLNYQKSRQKSTFWAIKCWGYLSSRGNAFESVRYSLACVKL